ncbi:hypothetical protein ACFPN2_24455 [Steroidobacter flavus]|uniref:Uncharacterized protein n=1 Tax=Steroidobacter flavus TaxID=1842136 RepID=A0ABV8SXB8_9GAMM
MVAIPCIRHGHASASDPRLMELLAMARELSGEDLEAHLESLLDYNGGLWATWRDTRARDVFSSVLTQAWMRVGGEGALHLISVGEQYDYQEDIMNSVD